MMPERLLGSGDGITTRSNRGALGGLSPEMFRRKFQPTTGHGPNSAVAYGGDRPVSRSKTTSPQKAITSHLLPRLHDQYGRNTTNTQPKKNNKPPISLLVLLHVCHRSLGHVRELTERKRGGERITVTPIKQIFDDTRTGESRESIQGKLALFIRIQCRGGGAAGREGGGAARDEA